MFMTNFKKFVDLRNHWL